MIPKGVPVEIGDKMYNLVFTVAATEYIIGRYGSLKGMNEGMGIKDIPDGEEEDGTPKTRQEVDDGVFMREAPWLVAMLANQGIMVETHDTNPDNPKLLKPEYVKLYTQPYALKDLVNAAMQAIAIGSGVEFKAQDSDGPKDLVLEEIEKNVPAAE